MNLFNIVKYIQYNKTQENSNISYHFYIYIYIYKKYLVDILFGNTNNIYTSFFLTKQSIFCEYFTFSYLIKIFTKYLLNLISLISNFFIKSLQASILNNSC